MKRPKHLGSALTLSVGLSLMATNASALDSFFIGPRAQGMAGANVASTNDTTAQYYNPAAFGFFGRAKTTTTVDEAGVEQKVEERLEVDNNNMGRKFWGVGVGAGVGYRQHNEFGKFVDDISQIEFKELSANGVQNESDLEKLVRIAHDLEGLDDPGNAVSVNADAAVGVRVGHFGIGVLGMTQATGQVITVDTTNLGFEMAVDTVKDKIATASQGAAYDDPSYTWQILTLDQRSQLCTALNSSMGVDGNCLDSQATLAVKGLDYYAQKQGVTTESAQQAIDILDTSFTNSATGTTYSLSDNTTTVLLKGFGVAEIPISYGFAINDHLSIGGNLKFMKGRVYANEILVFDNNSGDTLAKSEEFYQETNTFGVDLGVMARTKMLSFGLVGRNLNSPKFDGFSKTITINDTLKTVTAEGVTIEPQFAAGLAFIPFETLTLETDIDLTKNKTVFSEYETQNFSFGLEWDAFRFLALRAGVFKNLAESDIGWVYTAGLGLNLWAIRLDVAGAMSGEKEQFDGSDVPKESRVAAQLSIDF